MSEWTKFRSVRWFGSLDGLRAVAILAVIFHHACGFALEGTPFAGAGRHGVTLFFAISGFLITTLLLREREEHSTIRLRAFYARRALRIFPLYYAVLLLYVALVWLTEPNSEPGRAFVRHFPYFATYTSNWFVHLNEDGGRVIFYFAWSLATEEQFYLLWPSVEKSAPRRAPWVMLLTLALVVAVDFGLTPIAEETMAHTIITSISPAIGFGVLLAHGLHAPKSFQAVYRWLGHRYASLASFLALAGVIYVDGHSYWVPLACALCVGACVIREDHGTSRLLTTRMLQRIGAVSYGMYLLHMIAVNLVNRGLQMANVDVPTALRYGLVTLTAYAMAWFSYRYYESRWLRYAKRFRRAPSKPKPLPNESGWQGAAIDWELPATASRQA